jgi:hypothetical protein
LIGQASDLRLELQYRNCQESISQYFDPWQRDDKRPSNFKIRLEKNISIVDVRQIRRPVLAGTHEGSFSWNWCALRKKHT